MSATTIHWHANGGPTTTAAPGLGACLRGHRMTARWSQLTLAERAGLIESHVSRIESGTRRPTRATAEALCDALGLAGADRYELLGYAGFCPLPMTRDLARILAAIAACATDGRDDAQGMGEAA